ncbi:MAG: hypothetical protein ONB14_11600, partial [candidate division KSB1 bacterium]|nr:hypothetical protein [candidate division KSB1 bacterium]
RTSYTTGSTTVGPKSITGFFSTLTFGGFYVSKPWADYEGILWSTADDRVAWYATATAKGNAFANMENLIASASKKIGRRLVADGVFQKMKR